MHEETLPTQMHACLQDGRLQNAQQLLQSSHNMDADTDEQDCKSGLESEHKAEQVEQCWPP